MTEPRERPTRADYPHFLDVPTRWMDNDVYGHVNNVVYYAFFDTAINRYLIDAGGLDIFDGPVIGLAVETGCSFAKAVRFPDALEAGLRVAKLGTSSVRYEVGIFVKGEPEASAHGHFVHVFVDRATRRATPIPQRLREAMARLLRA
ncbi:MAG: thioesterase family protein [Polyangiales bacterium]